ncbi:MAG: hypothetical protein ACE5OO_02200 [Candidatus Bathyarchaeia archaeon]
MYDITAVILKIIKVLRVHEDVKEPDVIRKYHYGEPVRKDRFPIAWVGFHGGRTEPDSFGIYKHNHLYSITVADQSHVTDAAEKSVHGLAKKIDDVLKADATLGGLVKDTVLVNIPDPQSKREKDWAKSKLRLDYQITVLEE